MYCGVPMTAPVSVRCVLPTSALAIPKSVRCTWPSASSRMLAGFTSRWITPRLCAQPRPAAASSMMRSTSSNVSTCLALMISFSERPETKCIV